MKKFPKLVQMDSRGQIVIPKDIRTELGIDEGVGFWVYSIQKEGILLKKIDKPDFDDKLTKEIEDNSPKVGVNKKNLKMSSEKFRKGKGGRLDVV